MVGAAFEIYESTIDNLNKLYLNGGGGITKVTVIEPFPEVTNFQVAAKIKSDHAHYDDICLCGFSLIDTSLAFKGCSFDYLPHSALIQDPPFNDTTCKKEMIVNFGNLQKREPQVQLLINYSINFKLLCK